MNFTDRIKPTDKGITTYLDELKNKDYQIPTFQTNRKDINLNKISFCFYIVPYPSISVFNWQTQMVTTLKLLPFIILTIATA